MVKLWCGSKLSEVIGARVFGQLPDIITGVSIDSRTISKGEVFIAVAGDRFNGHDFIAGAFAAGAACVIADHHHFKHILPLMPSDGAVLVVDDTMDALRDLAVAARRRSGAKIIAITGSAGKTTTKEALALALTPMGQVHFSPSSFNNHWGVPLSLARMPADCDFAIFELGMNNKGEIASLCQFVRPHIAIITNVGSAHLANFASELAIADAKAEIFTGVVAGGMALLNKDNDYFDHLRDLATAQGLNIASFGLGADKKGEYPDAYAIKWAAKNSLTVVKAVIDGQEQVFKFGGGGDHLVINMLAVLLAIARLDLNIALAGLALADFKPLRGRGAQSGFRLANGSFILIDESYNANPASVTAAFNRLASYKTDEFSGRLIAVLGDMRELGSNSQQLHADLAKLKAVAAIDQFYLCGDLMQSLWFELPLAKKGYYAPTSDQLYKRLVSSLAPGDVVMIKGSLASGMTHIVNNIRSSYTMTDDAVW